MQVFGEIEDRRLDLAMDGVGGFVRRVAERYEKETQSEALEATQLLSDEGLGQARITLQDNGNRVARTRRSVLPDCHLLASACRAFPFQSRMSFTMAPIRSRPVRSIL